MKKALKSISRTVELLALVAILTAGVATRTAQAEEWQATVGGESPDRGRQALAFLPNELWVHTGDRIRWNFPTHERHTLTFLKPGQTRPPGFGPIFGVPVGCPGLTPDGSSFDGSACVTTGILRLDEDTGSTASAPTYSVHFPAPGNFKFVCLLHADMTGVVHVLNLSDSLPHDQDFYDRQAQSEQVLLLADASRLRSRGTPGHDDRAQSGDGGRGTPGGGERAQSGDVAAGIGEIVTTTGAGSQTASLMRFLRDTIVVRVGDTVEWTMLDPSINHTVTFGAEPADPRPPSANVLPTSDGARHAIIGSPTDGVNSGFLSPAPQDRAGLAQSPPGITRFRVTFTSPGTFNYICAIHDELGMKGTVIVDQVP
ncbi:MAG TPA: plastocyanin/azurin family copper-binding protein [Thermoanaerobaculia bacterium]|nr:plastocyanin/azurin family copper-binding protein [Thermoanaerobaculia bacterium]